MQTRLKIRLKPIWDEMRPVRDAARRTRYGVSRLLRSNEFLRKACNLPRGRFATTSEWLAASPGSTGNCYIAQAEHVNDPYVWTAVLANGKFWSRYGGCTISPDDYLLGDLSRDVFAGPDHRILATVRLPPTDLRGTKCGALFTPESSNYFHWLFDVLPRIGVLEETGFPISSFDCILVNELHHPFQRESLQMAGISETQTFIPLPSAVYQFETLCVPNWPPRFTITEFACKFLTERFAVQTSAQSAPVRKLYLSRSRAAFRRLSNEDELQKLLISFGFEIVHLEALSFREQIALMQQAQIVVSAHGAGLSNTVFCAPETRVVELLSPSYAPTLYSDLAKQARLRYHSIIGKQNHRPRTEDQARYADFEVDVKSLSAALGN